MVLSRSAPFLNIRLFFCFNSEFYDREQNTIFLLRLSRPQAPFLCERTRFWVLERCRRRLFLLKKHVLGPGTFPQAPFFDEKTRFWFQEGGMEFLDTCNQVPGGDGQSFSAHLTPPPH